MKSFVVSALLAVGVGVFAAGAAAKNPNGDQPSPIARGPHISGVVHYRPAQSAAASAPTGTSCSQPGNGNYMTDCHSSGAPVNETWVAYGPNPSLTGSMYYAGANDYNSYNGQGQDGFYWSTDGKTWNDAGPINVFPQNPYNGAGDPGLAVGSDGTVYYSSLLFNYNSCSVGGVELLRRNPSTGTWSSYQIAANTSSQFQDKPAMALSGTNVYVSWTQFQSCTGSSRSPIQVAVLPQGPKLSAATQILSLPTGSSTYSQGSSIASDGSGGFWIAWEEFPNATATNGWIQLAHYNSSLYSSSWEKFSSNGNKEWETISPSGFQDLPNPLPGFKFRDNSFPALTVTSTGPEAVWTSYDSGVGRAYLWNGGSATRVSDTGGDQFFPSIAPDPNGGVYVAFSQTNPAGGHNSTYDQYLWHTGDSSASKVSTASSNPSQDWFFRGQFIGDYNGMVVANGAAHPIWTDIRSSDPIYPGWEMDSMSYEPTAPTPGFALSATTPASVPAGTANSTSSTVTVTPSGGYSGTVDLTLTSAPSGVTASSAPIDTSSSSLSTPLTINTPSSLQAGTYNLTIQGQDSLDSSLTSTTNVTLTVTSTSTIGSFSLSVSPGNRTIRNGTTSTTYTVTVAPSGGYAGTVILSLSNAPSGVTASPALIDTSSSSLSTTVTVQTGTVSNGTYTLTFTGTDSSDASLTASATAKLKVH